MFNLMVEHEAAELDAVFRALADPTRRSMLRQLALGQRTVGELAEPFDMSLAGASKHIKVLERAGLVRRRVRGRTHTCRLQPTRLAQAYRWLAYYERFWASQLQAVDDLLRTEERASPRSPSDEEKDE